MTELQRKAIERHGQNLLAIFPGATERDPVKLCQKLRRLEHEAGQYTLALCNGDYATGCESVVELRLDSIKAKLDKLLRFGESKVPVFINRDPRGYALKIQDFWMRQAKAATPLHEDGGYGIIAPEIGPKGE